MSTGPWLRQFHQVDIPIQVVILPHAGGAASYYYQFSTMLSSDASVHVVQYPGRQDRRSEPIPASIGGYVENLLSELDSLPDSPLILYGHSMGAIIAYETAMLMSRCGGKRVAGLIVSGRRAPSARRHEVVHQGGDSSLIADVMELDDSSGEAFRDPEIREMVLPAIRADYRAIETYVAEDGAKVSCPITVFNGDSDPRSSPEEAAAWEAHTTDEFRLETFAGGHFFVRSSMELVGARLRVEVHRFADAALNCASQRPGARDLA